MFVRFCLDTKLHLNFCEVSEKRVFDGNDQNFVMVTFEMVLMK